MSELSFDAETQRVLERFGFDRALFATLQERLRTSGGVWSNVARGTVEPPRPGDITPLPPTGSDERRQLAARGREALARGEVGVMMLAGGMATRFGGAVKAACEVLPGRTFLDLKLADVAQVAREAGRPVPAYLMASFATCDAVRALGAEASREVVPVETFTQSVSIRLTPTGEVFRDRRGRPSLYAPGHGDLPAAARASGVLARFRAGGGRLLLVSNVDNVAATLDPAVIGAHLASRRPLTVEVVDKEPGDRGGAPARLDGALQVIEAFRFPPGFDQDAIPVFNTNTFVLDADVLDRDYDLTWFAVRKALADGEAVQFERLLGQITAFLPAVYLRVERDGPDGRFQPAKDPEELDRRRVAIARVLEARGLL